MSTSQDSVSEFRTAKKDFLEKARNATVTDGVVDGIEEMDGNLVRNLTFYSTCGFTCFL
jgi:hypothetical protein